MTLEMIAKPEVPKPRKLGIGGHHRGWKGKSDIWLTPPHVLKALGRFDFDPCAAPDPRPWPTADDHWVDGGLDRNWPSGKRAWVNPPYGPQTIFWLKRLADHGNGIAIVFARTETAMFFEQVWPRADAILFLQGRLHFHRADGSRADANAGGPSALIAYGPENATMLRDCGLPGKFIALRK